MNFTGTVENLIKSVKNKLSQAQLACIVSAILVGILAHGYCFFNRLSYHDNSASLFSLGATFESGRWFLGIIYRLQILSTKSFSLPLFNGFLSLLLIALSGVFILAIFDVKKRVPGTLVGAVMVVYPVVTSIFSFMFTSWPYFLGLFFAVLSAYVLKKKQGVFGFIAASLLCACSLGIYQAFFAVTITLLLLDLLLETVRHKLLTVGAYVKKGIISLCSLCVGLGLWAVIRKGFMAILHIEAVAYKGMDEGYALNQLPSLFIKLFKEFLGFRQAGINSLRYLRMLTLLVFVISLIQLIYIVIKSVKGTGLKLITFAGCLFIPIAMDVVYLLSTSSEYRVDSLMLYGNIFVLIAPIVFVEELETLTFTKKLPSKLMATVTWVQLISLLVITVGYVYLDNAAYLKADLAVEQARVYYTQLVANIKASPDFADDLEIVFVGWDELDDGTFATPESMGELDAIAFDKFPRYTDIVTYSGSDSFLREHVGFGNELLTIDHGKVAAEPEVKKMPCYPNAGSIAVVDGRVIVKLGQE